MEYKEIKFSQLKKSNNYKNEPLLIIKTPLLIPHLVIPTFLILAIFWAIISGQSTPYLFPLIILFAFLLNNLWKLFEPIKIIKIDRANKSFTLIPRNLIERLFTTNTKIYFAEIQKFAVTEGPEITMEGTRYIISAVLKDSTNIYFSQTNKKAALQEMLEFLNQTLSANRSD